MECIELGRLDFILVVDDLQAIPRYYNLSRWLTNSYLGIVAKALSVKGQITFNEFVQVPQRHLPKINSGAEPIDLCLHQNHHSRHISMIVQRYIACGMLTAQTNNLMCVLQREQLTLCCIRLPTMLINESLMCR